MPDENQTAGKPMLEMNPEEFDKAIRAHVGSELHRIADAVLNDDERVMTVHSAGSLQRSRTGFEISLLGRGSHITLTLDERRAASHA